MTDFTVYIAAINEILDKESWNADACLGLNALLDILRKENIEYEDIDTANVLIDEIIEYTTYSDGCEYLDTFAAIRIRLDDELIGLYDHVELHVGQFTLPIDTGCLNEERTAFRKEALAYIREMLEFPHLSDKMRNAVVEGFIKNFCLYRY